MYGGGGPSQAELSLFGLTLDDVATDDSDVWPENWQAYLLFASLSTQWRVGFSGATGLDYNVLYHKLDRMRLSDEDYEVLETDIRIMESAALKEMSRDKK